jgi:hypothetical protein
MLKHIRGFTLNGKPGMQVVIWLLILLFLNRKICDEKFEALRGKEINARRYFIPLFKGPLKPSLITESEFAVTDGSRVKGLCVAICITTNRRKK